VIAAGLGLRKVGFIFTQTVSLGKRDYTLSNAEIRQAAEFHAESDFEYWATAIVKLEVNEDGGPDVHFEAFQLSDQCVKLFKDGWFVENVPDLDPKLTRMKKEVILLQKDTYDVDNDFFLVPVKIFDHEVCIHHSSFNIFRIFLSCSRSISNHFLCLCDAFELCRYQTPWLRLCCRGQFMIKNCIKFVVQPAAFTGLDIGLGLKGEWLISANVLSECSIQSSDFTARPPHSPRLFCCA